jgi:hypothetical protein
VRRAGLALLGSPAAAPEAFGRPVLHKQNKPLVINMDSGSRVERNDKIYTRRIEGRTLAAIGCEFNSI